MMIASTVIALVAVILCDSVFARPQFVIKIPGNEYILRSCIASAQLSRRNRNKDILSPDVPIRTSINVLPHHLRLPSVLSSDVPGEHSQIIKINAIPYQSRDKSGGKFYPRLDEKTGHEEPLSDTPLKTVKVQPIRDNGPIVFKEKNRLPHLAHDVSSGNERKSAMVILIKPSN